ncbi:ABC transporter ATP-binding protein [Labrys wisconsinensis]|uniref:Spermidine/putrescine transport system ATP-binding protein n=1 Tax=Labrys wisconsinensis TaxID=425677 RepID=A0ABU0J4G7_9HYPH|nr:ABC transporter ATP-binding protein [Labrys wisconsinensis]MDQ0469165.1 spermidine/putrescine transport system ATP-binding protein [Labrys wisconsinensis]
MNAPLLVLDKVEKQYDGFAAVKSIDLVVESGEFVAIMGPSGCGKTTTLRMIAGLEVPTGGEIRLRGKVLNHVDPWERQTPLVWQSLALFPFLNVRQNVEFGLKMRGIDATTRRAKADGWLERLGLEPFATRAVTQLSGGQRQRVALARSLVLEPELLLLDEPLSALDAHLVVKMQAELIQLQKQLGITFCYVTHSQSEAFAMADRVVIMNGGTIQQVGAPRQIFRKPANRFVAEFIGTNNIINGVARTEGGDIVVESGFGTLEPPSHGAPMPGRKVELVIGADFLALSRERPALPNVVPVRVIGEQFVGSVVVVHLEAGDERSLRAQLPLHLFEQLAPAHGEALFAGWQPENAYLLEQ